MNKKSMQQLISVGLVALFAIGCSAQATSIPTLPTPTLTPVQAVEQNRELFGAISLGLPLGVLAAKYIPSLPDTDGDVQRRENYTQLLQMSLDDLNIKLDPPPASLLSAGRGQQQYQYIESYFEQIIKQTDGRSPCIKFTAGLSLNSAWLILAAHQARSIDVTDLTAFKQDVSSRLDQFLGLSSAVSLFCKQEGFADFSAKLDAVSNDSQSWLNRINEVNNNEVVAEVESIVTSLSNWLVDLSEVASGLSTP